jgi:hypothetical protein
VIFQRDSLVSGCFYVCMYVCAVFFSDTSIQFSRLDLMLVIMLFFYCSHWEQIYDEVTNRQIR